VNIHGFVELSAVIILCDDDCCFTVDMVLIFLPQLCVCVYMYVHMCVLYVCVCPYVRTHESFCVCVLL